MSDTVYAASLGLVIPVLTTSVVKKLWKHGRAKARGRSIPRKSGLLNLSFVVQLSSLLAACYAFNRVASSIQTENEHFDPFYILELPSRANTTVIKSQYRRLSLRHHPDKNPGNRREANKRFNQVAKAYKALSDPEGRRNYKKYGHPDGAQPWTFDLALPGWLRPGKDCSDGMLALYGVGYLMVLIGFVLSVKMGLDILDPAGGGKKPEFEVTEEDVAALLQNLDDTSSTHDVIECLAACPQLCSDERQALAEEMEPNIALLRGWLETVDGGTAAPLPQSADRGSPPAEAPTPTATPPSANNSKKTGRKGKGKGASKAKGGVGGGGDGGSSGGGDAEASDKGSAAELSTGGAGARAGGEKLEGEFFSRGRKGEGNRRRTRASPELSQVVTHNLVVLLSALHRASFGVTAGVVGVVGGVGGVAADEGDTPSSSGLGGGQGYSSRSAASGEIARLAADAAVQLRREQDMVFGLAEPLLDACLQVASKRASPQLFATVIEAKAMLRRRLWSAGDPAALDRQQTEADVDLDAAIPSIKVDSVVVETWAESQVALGDTVTATITITREHASDYKGFRGRKPEGGFLSKGEPWWVILAGGRGGDTLIGVTPMLVENLASDVAECKIKFQAPRRPGIVPLMVFVKSPIFVGADCESSSSFRVYRHDELRDDEDAGDW